MTLEAVPQSLFSWRFTVRDQRGPVADLNFGFWNESGSIDVGTDGFRVRREFFMGGDFILEGPAGVVARARKPSAWLRHFIVEHGNQEYALRARTAFFREFVLLQDDREVGCITPQGVWRRHANARLPDDWPLPVQIFVLWLVLLLWRRDANAGSAAGAD